MKTTQKIVFASLLAALVCVATYVIQIPSPLHGYINLGDCFVLLSACLLPAGYGFCAAAIGSSLADLFAGYASYAPATFLIKGIMVLIVIGICRLFAKKGTSLIARLIGFILAEAWMVLGYYLFEGFLYGFTASLVNIPANIVQGIAGIAVGILLVKLTQKLHAHFLKS